MNVVDGLWEDVLVGNYVQDKKGKWWKVVDLIFAGRWVLEDSGGKRVEIPQPEATRPVTIMYDPKKLIEQTLDGKEIR